MSAGMHKIFFKLLLLKEGTKKLKNWTRDIDQSLNAMHLLHKLVHSVEEDSGTLLMSQKFCLGLELLSTVVRNPSRNDCGLPKEL